jgi:hypothetical protein
MNPLKKWSKKMTKKDMIKTIEDEFEKAWELTIKEREYANDCVERGIYKDKYECFSFSDAQSRALALWDIMVKLELKK